MRPIKLPAMKAIPPPPGMKDNEIPEKLRIKLTPEERAKAQSDFEWRANNEYYAEWFWFPFSKEVWVNTWSTDNDVGNTIQYPSNTKRVLEVFGTITVNVAQNIVKPIEAFGSHRLRTKFLSWIAMKNLDAVEEDQPPIRTLIPNALHFQRGIQNLRVRDVEVEFPITAKKEHPQVRDYANAQKAWWDAIIAVYQGIESHCPQRMPVEMRIMGDSEITMAPQRGFALGTVSIEILTLEDAKDLWQPHAQKVIDKWTSLKDVEGRPLPVRPHWAKEWKDYTVDGKPWPEVLKNELYPEQIKEFKRLLSHIGEKQGWQLGDLKRMFSNEAFDSLFFSDVQSTSWPLAAPLKVPKAGVASLLSTPELDHDSHTDVSSGWSTPVRPEHTEIRIGTEHKQFWAKSTACEACGHLPGSPVVRDATSVYTFHSFWERAWTAIKAGPHHPIRNMP